MTPEEHEMLLEMPAVQELLAQEREACARLADAYAANPFPAYRAAAVAIAADIRARKGDSP